MHLILEIWLNCLFLLRSREIFFRSQHNNCFFRFYPTNLLKLQWFELSLFRLVWAKTLSPLKNLKKKDPLSPLQFYLTFLLLSAPLDKRNFEYTRQQWTGKSPKQFLIDWVRKHLPGSPPPKYFKVDMGRNLWRSRSVIRFNSLVLERFQYNLR